MFVGWRAWYEDGSVYDSKTLTFRELPDDGILVIMRYEDRRDPASGRALRQIVHGFDWYFEATSSAGIRFIAQTNDDPDEILARYKDAVVKRGKFTDPETYDRVIKAAYASAEL